LTPKTFCLRGPYLDAAAAHLMTKDEARKIAAGIAKLPELLTRARRAP
jgi:hypothetical protein